MTGKNVVRSIIVLCLLLLAMSAYAKNNTAEKEKLNLKENKVKSVTEYLYFPRTKTQKKKSLKEYNNEGVRKVLIDFDDQEKQLRKTEYSSADNLETGYIEYDANNNIRLKCESHYNASKSIVTDENFYDKNDILAYKRVYSYDSSENLIEQIMYDKNNKLVNKSSFKYDNAGNKIEAVNYDNLNNMTGRFEFKYNEKVNLTEQIIFNKENKNTGRRTYSYTNSLVSEMTGFNTSGTQNICCRYNYDFFAAEPVQASKNNDTKPVELIKTSEVQLVHNNLSTSETQITASDSEENKIPEYMKNLSESEKKDIEFYYSLQDMQKADYDEIKTSFEKNKLEVNSQNSIGISYLMMAVFWGNKDAVKYLLENGADLGLKDHMNHDVKFYLKYAEKTNPQITQMINEAQKK